MADAFINQADQVSAPATRVAAVVPHDTSPLPDIPKALFVGSGGTVVLRGVAGGVDASFRNVASGTLLPVRVSHVRASGTTASDIVALY